MVDQFVLWFLLLVGVFWTRLFIVSIFSLLLGRASGLVPVQWCAIRLFSMRMMYSCPAWKCVMHELPMVPENTVVFDAVFPFKTSETNISASDPLFSSVAIFVAMTRPTKISWADAVCVSRVMASVQLQAYAALNVQASNATVMNLRSFGIF